MRMRIGAKLMLLGSIGTLVTVSMVSLAAFRIAREGLEKQIASHLESVAQSRAAHVDTFIGDHKGLVELAATSIILAEGLRALEAGGADRDAVVERMSARAKLFIDPEGHIHEIFVLDRHGGAIDVQGEPGKGTTIEAFLPVATDQEEA